MTASKDQNQLPLGDVPAFLRPLNRDQEPPTTGDEAVVERTADDETVLSAGADTVTSPPEEDSQVVIETPAEPPVQTVAAPEQPIRAGKPLAPVPFVQTKSNWGGLRPVWEAVAKQVALIRATPEQKLKLRIGDAIESSRGVIAANDELGRILEAGKKALERGDEKLAASAFEGLVSFAEAPGVFPTNFEKAVDGAGELAVLSPALRPRAIQLFDSKFFADERRYQAVALRGEPLARAIVNVEKMISAETAPAALAFLDRVTTGKHSGKAFENAVSAVAACGLNAGENRDVAVKAIGVLDRITGDNRVAKTARETAIDGIGNITAEREDVAEHGLAVLDKHLVSGQFKGKAAERIVADIIETGDASHEMGVLARSQLRNALILHEGIRKAHSKIILGSFAATPDGEEFDAAKACIDVHDGLKGIDVDKITKESLADAVEVLAQRMNKPDRILALYGRDAEILEHAALFTRIDESEILKGRVDAKLMDLFNEAREFFKARDRLVSHEAAVRQHYGEAFSPAAAPVTPAQ